MCDITIRAYRPADIAYIVAGWNESLPNDPITEERFLQEIALDENFDADLALVCETSEPKLVGFSLGMRRKYPYLTRGLEPDRGWISSFFICPEFRGKGYGQKLLVETEKRLKEAGTKEITLFAYSPNYFTPGVDISYPGGVKFFDAAGYNRGTEAVSMSCDLFCHTLPEKVRQDVQQLAEQGIRFRMYQKTDMGPLLEFVSREFDAGWVRNILQAMRKNEAEDTILLAVDSTGKVLGYCMRKIDGCDGRFGPIGVAQELRSRGLGGILLELQMQEMRKRKIYTLYFLWTHGDAMRFYARHGLTPYRTYQLYRKKL